MSGKLSTLGLRLAGLSLCLCLVACSATGGVCAKPAHARGYMAEARQIHESQGTDDYVRNMERSAVQYVWTTEVLLRMLTDGSGYDNEAIGILWTLAPAMSADDVQGIVHALRYRRDAMSYQNLQMLIRLVMEADGRWLRYDPPLAAALIADCLLRVGGFNHANAKLEDDQDALESLKDLLISVRRVDYRGDAEVMLVVASIALDRRMSYQLRSYAHDILDGWRAHNIENLAYVRAILMESQPGDEQDRN